MLESEGVGVGGCVMRGCVRISGCWCERVLV